MNNKSWKRGIGWYLAAVLASVAVLTGCGNAVGQNAKKEDDGKLNVVTTLFPYYDFARQIAGDAVDLTMVVPAGMDSHSFEPTPADPECRRTDLQRRRHGAMADPGAGSDGHRPYDGDHHDGLRGHL